MTKVDSQKPREGPPKSSMGSWCNSLQPLVIQPCSTEWPEWPPGATVTVTKLNVSVSLLQFSVVFLAHLLSFSSFSTADIWTHNEISTKVTTEAFSKGLFFSFRIIIILWANQHLLLLSVQTSLFAPSQAALQALWSCLSLFLLPLTSAFFPLIYCELISKFISPLSLQVKISFLSSFL